MDQDTESNEIPQEPISNEVHEIKKGNAEILTHEELVEQTRQFMQRFQEKSQSGELPDTVFFLDKKARPLAYMFRKLFPSFCPDSQMPAIRYINIGREHDFDQYDDTTKDRPFNGDPSIITSTYGKYIDTKGKITIVDEYVETGNTINNASSIISQAFPDAEVTSLSAYSNPVEWDELGVDEYTIDNYMDMAVESVNDELGTQYKSAGELLFDSMNSDNNAKEKYDSHFKQLEGSIPYTKRADVHQPVSISHKIKALAGKVVGMRQQEKMNYLRQARKALDTVCEEVIASSATQEHI